MKHEVMFYDKLHKLSENRASLLIAAPNFSAGYYSAPNFFLHFKEFELYWGAVFFMTGRGVLEKSFFSSILLD